MRNGLVILVRPGANVKITKYYNVLLYLFCYPSTRFKYQTFFPPSRRQTNIIWGGLRELSFGEEFSVVLQQQDEVVAEVL